MGSKSDLNSARVKTFINEYVKKVLISKKLQKLRGNGLHLKVQKTVDS